MASQVDIYNRALSKLGAKRVISTSDNSQSARSCNACYDDLRQSELRKHDWNFAIQRATLAAISPQPINNPVGGTGRQNAFQLPVDFLKLTNVYPEVNMTGKDWVIEGQTIVTNDQAPLYIRYIYDVQDPNLMDPLFRETLATIMAFEMCEELTQSNTKKDSLEKNYIAIMETAKHANSIEIVSAQPPVDTWITARWAPSPNWW